MKLKKINKFAEKRAKALYIYLQALWENKQEKACYIQDADYKKREAEKLKKLKRKYVSLSKHYIKAIRKDAEDKYSSKITVDVNAFKALTEKHLYDKHLDYNQTIKDYYECEFSEP